MAAKKDLEALLARVEAAVKAGDAGDPKKKAALVRDLRELKAGLKKELHGPLDELLQAVEEDAVGLEAKHPAFVRFLDHASRLLASIGI
jgi:hypothetical protein